MHVSTQSGLSLLPPTPSATAVDDQVSSTPGQVSPVAVAADDAPGQASMTALMGPAQMFTQTNLGALISSQSSASSGDGTSDGAVQPATLHNHHGHHPVMQAVTPTQEHAPMTDSESAVEA